MTTPGDDEERFGVSDAATLVERLTDRPTAVAILARDDQNFQELIALGLGNV